MKLQEMEKCKRLGEYSQFIQCVRDYINLGYGKKQAVVKAVDECISKGILEDVLVKHRAEVFDMFLTKFDKKMYEEAIRQEGRDELAEKYEELAQKHSQISQEHAERLRANGIPYETAKNIVTELDEKILKEIYAR